MAELALALTVLSATHILPSLPGVRHRLVETLGRPAFLILYSTVSLALIAWTIKAYRDAPYVSVWALPEHHRWLAVFAMPLALWLVVARLSERAGEVPCGIYRVCAVPGSVGLAIWAGLHLVNVGHGAGVLTFAAFALIAAFAAIKNWLIAPPARRMVGPVPFLAILMRREVISLRDLKWAPMAVALALWLALLALHPLVLGVDPAPGLFELSGVWVG